MFTNGTRTERVVFETTFLRPNRLRFIWRRDVPNFDKIFGIWCDGSRVISVFNGEEPEAQIDLRSSVASATGTSAAACSKVLPLLMEELRPNCKSLLELQKTEILDRVCIRDLACFVVKGTLLNSNECTLWVSSEDFSLRRLQCRITEGEENFVGEYDYLSAVFDKSVVEACWSTVDISQPLLESEHFT